MALDFQSLMAGANVAGYSGLASESDTLELALLQYIAKIVAPTVATDYQSLLSSANVAGYAGLTSIPHALKLALLQIIANNVSSGGGSSGFSSGAVNPVNGTTTGSFYVNTAAGTGFVSQNNGTTWTQIF